MSISSDSDSFHSPPDAYGTHTLSDLNESKPSIDFATGAALLPGGSEAVPGALQAFNIESGQSVSVGHSEPIQRRMSMPASTRPFMLFQPQRPRHLKQQSMPHGPSALSLSASAYPMPPPANTLQITDTGHAGMAGSAPPNMNFSPSTGMGTLWIDESAKEGDMMLRGTSDTPSFKLSEPSSWARRGFGTLGDGLRPTEPAPLNPSAMPNSFGFGLTSIVPQGQIFQPSLGVTIALSPKPDGSHPHPPPSSPLQAQSAPVSSTSAPNPSTSPGALSSSCMTQAVLPSIYQSPMAQTVSPGAYSSMPMSAWASPRGTPSPPMPTVRGPTSTATKSERRMSLTHPYSPPRTRQPALAGLMPQVGGGRDALSINIPTVDSSEEDGLPSASLAQPELFGGELETGD